MKPYTFFKHDGSSVTPVFDLAEFEDDIAARAYALKLLAEEPKYHAVEVWDGVDDPFTVKRLSIRSAPQRTRPDEQAPCRAEP
jgi:hypothetical protein